MSLLFFIIMLIHPFAPICYQGRGVWVVRPAARGREAKAKQRRWGSSYEDSDRR